MNNYHSDVDNLRFILSRNLSDASRKPLTHFNKTINSNEDVLEKVEYNINSRGYRSSEFDKNNEVLVLGCSHTYGSGMPENFTWPYIFANSVEKKYSKIAIPGDSINAQVYKAFKYFEEVGNPKVVLGVFPLYRLEYLSVPGKFVSSAASGNTEQKRAAVSIAFFYEEYFLKFSKAPHNPEYILPRELVLFYNFMFIKMLEQYCESHNIKFIWSIYDQTDIEILMQSNKNILKNYLRTSDIPELCHLEQNSVCINGKKEHCSPELKDHKLYRRAADYDESKDTGHWGIHTHRHIAERFIDRYKEISNA